MRQEDRDRRSDASLFVYGTLRDPAVQRAVFGRVIGGTPDAVIGFRLGEVAIADPDVLAKSGLAVHRILHPTGEAADTVEGWLLDLTEPELLAADAYETDAYRRAAVRTRSGLEAWVYVAA